MKGFGEATRSWFSRRFGEPTRVQSEGWPVIASGRHALLIAPTGSGKTLAAFLHAVDAAFHDPSDRTRVVYVSPLKALVYDVERNLTVPLAGIDAAARELGAPLRAPTVDVRTGDTPAHTRRRQARRPGTILVTTPESLFLILSSRARENLSDVRTVIVDEVHAVAATKRGSHLALSLERLSALASHDPQRIGLSATVRPARTVAAFVGGDRDVTVVDAAEPPRLDLRVTVPVPDMARPPVSESADGRPPAEHGLWPAIYPELLREIRAVRSTIVFVNSRGLCERLCRSLNEAAGEEIALAHHGSLSHARREQIEDRLKRGELKALVATSSLELGIDMGSVDRVLLVESPGSATRGLQRVGRAGHGVGETSHGRIFPKFRGDLLECAAVARGMLAGELEPIRVPENALDVLAQQIVAIVAAGPRTVPELAALVRRAAPYRQLSDEALCAVLEMLSGRYPAADFPELRARLSWDRTGNILSPRRGAELLTRMNAGTIPDRGTFGVFAGDGGPRVGELDEEMVHETRKGDRILLGASTWAVEDITRDRVLVSPAPGEAGRLPFWHGGGPGRPVELGRAVGRLTREIDARDDAEEWLRATTPLDDLAATNLVRYVREQRAHTGCVPTDRSITVERFRDELGDERICILTPFGSRVHAPWAIALGGRLHTMHYTDDGIVFRAPDEGIDLAACLPDPDLLADRLAAELPATSLFAGLFRENAARALLLPRRDARRRRPLWLQRLKAQGLLDAARRFPSFPIVLETFRQILSDRFDVEALASLLRGAREGTIEVHDVETGGASPFARSLVFSFAASYVYEPDTPAAERRARALSVDRRLLAELVGEEATRELVDPDVLRELVAERSGTTRPARDADELHDLLRRVGALSESELRERSTGDPGAWLETLSRRGQATSDGASRWSAVEDVDLPPAELVVRFARSRGPFRPAEAAERLGFAVDDLLLELEREGRLLRGAFLPDGSGEEWCDPESWRILKGRSLAKARAEVEPVDAATWTAFLLERQGVGRDLTLEEAVDTLAGCFLPWETLDDLVLPVRVRGYAPGQLDALGSRGELVWAGRDGKIALFPRERLGLLAGASPAAPPEDPVASAIVTALEERGASFSATLKNAAEVAEPGLSGEELRRALLDLALAGVVTNDTLSPLRTGGRPRSARRPPPPEGRWSLVGDLVPELETTRAAWDRAQALLARYGVATRETASAESTPGGFAAVYPVLRALETSGRIRRGRFVDGPAAAQFAEPATVDRLRTFRDPQAGEATVLAAVDPANPYGSLVPWPAASPGGAPPGRRSTGIVVLAGGRPVLYSAGRGGRWTTFPDGDVAAAAAALLRRPRLVVREIDGVPARESSLRPLFVEAGFEADYTGLRSRRW